MEGFRNVFQGIHWPDLGLYELGEYAGAGVVGALTVVTVVFIGSIAYIAIGEITKTFKRGVSQRAINPLVSIRSHKNIPPPERKP